MRCVHACCLTGSKDAALISLALKPPRISDTPRHTPGFLPAPNKPTVAHASNPTLPTTLIPPPPTAFQVTTGNKTWFVKAADEDKEENLTNWVSAIRGAIARLKQETGSPEVSRVPEFTHHSIGGRDFVMDSRYTELK